jgi:hypothetical protein
MYAVRRSRWKARADPGSVNGKKLGKGLLRVKGRPGSGK